MITKTTELFVTAQNSTGLLSKILQTCKDAGMNIFGVSAFNVESTAYVRILGDNAQRAAESSQLTNIATSVEVINALVAPANDSAQLHTYAENLGDEGVDFTWAYTTHYNNQPSFVFSTKNNDVAASVINA